MKARHTARNAVEFALHSFKEALELTYIDAYPCANGDGLILDNDHAYIDPDGRHYHSRDCAMEAEAERENNGKN